MGAAGRHARPARRLARDGHDLGRGARRGAPRLRTGDRVPVRAAARLGDRRPAGGARRRRALAGPHVLAGADDRAPDGRHRVGARRDHAGAVDGAAAASSGCGASSAARSAERARRLAPPWGQTPAGPSPPPWWCSRRCCSRRRRWPATRAGRSSTPTSSPTGPPPRCSDPSVRDADRRAGDRSGRAAPPAPTCWPRGRSSRRRVSGVVGGGAFRSLFHRAALDVHRAVFEHDENTVTLTLADVGTVAGAALQSLRPELAAQVEDSGRVEVVSADIGGATRRPRRASRATCASLACLLAALTLPRRSPRSPCRSTAGVPRRSSGSGIAAGRARRRRSTRSPGRSCSTASTIPTTAPRRARCGTPSWATCAPSGWSSRPAGAIMAAAAASLIDPVDVEGALRARWRIATTEPSAARAARRCARVALVAVGVLVVAQAARGAAGRGDARRGLLVYAGRRGDPAAHLPAADPGGGGAPRSAAPAPRRGASRWPVRRDALVIAGRRRLPRPAAAPTPPAPRSRALRRPRRAVRPPARRGRPRRRRTTRCPRRCRAGSPPSRIARSAASSQDGIRGLLFDTHYADKLPNGRVRTYFPSQEDLDLVKNQDGVSDASFEAALRLRERLGFRGEGERGMYLCHTFCELGATPLSSRASTTSTTFLVTHPAEVVVDRQPGLRDARGLREAVGDAGLARYAFTPPGRRRLADAAPDDRRRPPARPAGREPRGRRALVPARPTSASTQETPFTFPQRARC